jgi:16S rRNA (cytosine967-C5)-methyltransferase
VPHAFPGHHVFTGSAAELAALLSVRDDLWVQDPGSAQAVQSVSDLRPALVLDLCAGQGTKTRQLAAVFPSAKIIATDVDAARLASLERTFARSERVSVLPRRAIQDKYIGKADLILLDVPCSNTGVLARRPEARLRFDPAHLKQLIDVQRQIIADSIPLLSEGRGGGGGGGGGRGKILYSTCSLEAMENIDQVRWADHWHRLGISRDRRQSPEGLPADPPPHVQYCDGSFAALLG